MLQSKQGRYPLLRHQVVSKPSAMGSMLLRSRRQEQLRHGIKGGSCCRELLALLEQLGGASWLGQGNGSQYFASCLCH